jgi:hypothetical protein
MAKSYDSKISSTARHRDCAVRTLRRHGHQAR